MSQEDDINVGAGHVTLRFVVSGRVQGVFFRVSTQRMADRFGLGGWVRNLPDGRVEGVVSGPSQVLGSFRDWLHHGPETAQVQRLEMTETELEEFSSFEIR